MELGISGATIPISDTRECKINLPKRDKENTSYPLTEQSRDEDMAQWLRSPIGFSENLEIGSQHPLQAMTIYNPSSRGSNTLL